SYTNFFTISLHDALPIYDNFEKDPYDMDEIIKSIVQALHFFSLFFKNPHLRQEEEIRYIIFNINEDNLLKPELYMNSKPFTTCKFTYEILKEIIIGSVAKLKLYAHLYKTIKANIVLIVKSFVSINYFSFFSINIT